MEFFLVQSKSLYSVQIRENTGQKTLFVFFYTPLPKYLLNVNTQDTKTKCINTDIVGFDRLRN